MQIKFKNLEELKRKYGSQIPDAISTAVAKKATTDAVNHVRSTVPPYPPTRPGQTYVRKVSAGIGGSITTEVRPVGARVVGLIGVNKAYSPWVVSSERVGGRGPQAWMHKGRWWTLQDVVAQARAKVMEIYESAFRALLK